MLWSVVCHRANRLTSRRNNFGRIYFRQNNHKLFVSPFLQTLIVTFRWRSAGLHQAIVLKMSKVWVRESRMSLLCSLICSCMHLPVSPTYALPHSQGIYSILFSWIISIFTNVAGTKCDLSVVSDLKTDHTPCCCRQRQSGADSPFMYGRTTVDLIWVVGSLLDACWFLDNRGIYFLRDSGWFSDRWKNIITKLVMIFFDQSYKHLTTLHSTGGGWCES